MIPRTSPVCCPGSLSGGGRRLPAWLVTRGLLFRWPPSTARLITVGTLYLADQFSGTADARYWYLPALLIAWVLFIVSAEFMPRRASRKAVNREMIRYLWLITTLYTIFSPMVAVYRSALIRGGQESPVTEEEKEEIVERAIETLAEQAGIGEAIVEEDEKEMIGHIFQLDQTLVREIMSPRINLVAIDKSIRFGQIQELVRRDGYSRYPVFEDTIDKIVGILYVKDLFSDLPRPGEEFVIADYLREPYFVPETKVIGELLREFRTRKLHVAIVVDDYGGVAGLVTLEDILEEIVGEIQDEHDSEADEYRLLPDGSYLVDASFRLDRLQQLLGTDHQQDENATVGGLLYDLVGSVPSEGTSLVWHDLTLEILKLEGQRIKSIKITQA